MTHVLVGVACSAATLCTAFSVSGRTTNPALFETHPVPDLLRVYRQTRQPDRAVSHGAVPADLPAIERLPPPDGSLPI